MSRRIDFVDTDLVTGWGELDAAPKHEPIIRPDRHCSGHMCNQGRGPACKTGCVPLKQPRVQVDAKPRAADVIHRADVQQASRLLSLKNVLMALFWWAMVFLAFFAFGYLSSGKAHAADAETTATIAAGADTVSTIAAVGSGMAIESNALIASPPVFLAVSVLKLAAPRMTRDMDPDTRRTTLRTMSTVWGGAAANNLAILAGVGCPLCVGVAVGVWLWADSGKPAATEPVTAPEAGAALAMVQP